jgi:hypothetical protein
VTDASHTVTGADKEELLGMTMERKVKYMGAYNIPWTRTLDNEGLALSIIFARVGFLRVEIWIEQLTDTFFPEDRPQRLPQRRARGTPFLISISSEHERLEILYTGILQERKRTGRRKAHPILLLTVPHPPTTRYPTSSPRTYRSERSRSKVPS